MANFNPKYDNYIRDLPKYVLKNIKNQISEKYPIDAENEFIDALFERKHQSYKKKREYDIGYYQKLQNTNEVKTNKLTEDIRNLELRLNAKTLEYERSKTELLTIQSNYHSLSIKYKELQLILKGALDRVAILQEHNASLGRTITPQEDAAIRIKLGMAGSTGLSKKKLRPTNT